MDEIPGVLCNNCNIEYDIDLEFCPRCSSKNIQFDRDKKYEPRDFKNTKFYRVLSDKELNQTVDFWGYHVLLLMGILFVLDLLRMIWRVFTK